MKRQTKTLLILAIVLVLIAGGYFLLRAMNAKEEQSQETEENILLAAQSLTALDVTREDETLRFVKEGDVWSYAPDASFPLDAEAFAEVTAALEKVVSKRVVEETPDDLSRYGLDTPTAVLKTTSQDGGTATLKLGAANDDAWGYYVMVGDDPAVYLVSKTDCKALDFKLYDVLKQDVPPTIISTSINLMRIRNGENTTSLYYNEDSSDKVYSFSFTWFLDEALSRAADATKAGLIADEVCALDFESCVNYSASGEALAPYGLAEPAGEALIRYEASTTDGGLEKKEFTLYWGDRFEQEGQEYVYCRMSDSNMVFTELVSDLNQLLESSEQDCLPTEICAVRIATIDEVEITVDGTKTKGSAKRDEEDNTTYYINGEEADKQAFVAMYTLLTNLHQESTAKEPAAGEQVILQIRFLRNTQTFQDLTLKVFTYDENFYRVEFNGRGDQLINRRQIDKFITALNGLL